MEQLIVANVMLILTRAQNECSFAHQNTRFISLAGVWAIAFSSIQVYGSNLRDHLCR